MHHWRLANILERFSIHLPLRIQMEPRCNELIEEGLEYGDHAFAPSADQDANGPDDWNISGYRQLAYCVVICEECGMLFDRQGDHE